jgi:hypothetical protein
MALRVVNLGLLSVLEGLRQTWLPMLRVGLYQSPVTVEPSDTIAQIEPAEFSGYTGLRTLSSWGAPQLVGARGVIHHVRVTWLHDGGPVPSLVFGYYVVDVAGTLIWAERTSEGGELIAAAGQFHSVDPTFSQRSEF